MIGPDPGRRPPISGLPEIGISSPQVGCSRLAMARPKTGSHLRVTGSRTVPFATTISHRGATGSSLSPIILRRPSEARPSKDDRPGSGPSPFEARPKAGSHLRVTGSGPCRRLAPIHIVPGEHFAHGLDKLAFLDRELCLRL